MKTISVEIPNDFDRRLRLVAAQMDLNRSELIRQVLEEKLPHLERQAGAREPEPVDVLVAGGAEACETAGTL